jgi:hypothetical protein
MGVSSYYAQSYSDDGQMGVPQLDVVPGNPICSFTPVQWAYATMYYVDAMEMAPTSQGIYTLGPDGYVFDSHYAGVYNVLGNSKVFTFTVETARIDTQENTDELFYQVIEYFRLITDVSKHFTDKTNEVWVYPNPANDIVTFVCSLNTSANIDLTLYDLTGQQLYSHKYGLSSGNSSICLDLKSLKIKSGLYTYIIKTDEQIITGKLIVR